MNLLVCLWRWSFGLDRQLVYFFLGKMFSVSSPIIHMLHTKKLRFHKTEWVLNNDRNPWHCYRLTSDGCTDDREDCGCCSHCTSFFSYLESGGVNSPPEWHHEGSLRWYSKPSACVFILWWPLSKFWLLFMLGIIHHNDPTPCICSGHICLK